MSAADEKSILTTSIDADTLRTTLDILQTTAKEAKLHLGADGLRTKVVDPASVMMIDIQVSPAAFQSVPSGSFTVGTDLEKLEELISKADADQTIDFSYKPETRELDISYNRASVDMACIDPDAIRQEPDLPEDMELPNHFTADLSEFRNGLEMAEVVSNHVDIVCNSDADEVVISAEGDTDDTTWTLTDDELSDYHIREDTLSKYSQSYLTFKKEGYGGLLKHIPDGDVTVSVGDEFPMWVEFSYAGGAASVTAMLAPRIAT